MKMRVDCTVSPPKITTPDWPVTPKAYAELDRLALLYGGVVELSKWQLEVSGLSTAEFVKDR